LELRRTKLCLQYVLKLGSKDWSRSHAIHADVRHTLPNAIATLSLKRNEQRIGSPACRKRVKIAADHVGPSVGPIRCHFAEALTLTLQWER